MAELKADCADKSSLADGFIEQDLGSDNEETHRRAAADNQRLDLQRRQEEELNAEDIAARINERYKSRGGLTAKSDFEHVPQRMLMPSVNDPGLYSIRCKPGRERAVVQTILRKAVLGNTPKPMNIISAFCRDTLVGRVYVEATEPKHVMDACEGISGAYPNEKNLFLVPISEMADLLKITKVRKELKQGSWVRFKRGKYAGDLAQVLDMTENGEMCGVKFVPRLDLDPREDSMFTDSLGRKRKKGAIGSAAVADRPPPRFFNAEEVRKIFTRERLEKKGLGYLFRGKTYVDGYCEDDVRVSALITENVNPTLDEFSRFIGKETESGQALDKDQMKMLADATNAKAEVVLRRDDHVEVFEGEQAGVEGVIDTVAADVVTIKFQLSEHDEQTIEVPIASVRKKFRPGDHIKVISGKHADETGLVVKVEGNLTTFLSDLNLNEISVFSKDIHEAAEVGSGVNAVAGYELHNLVQLDVQTAGVIFKIERDIFMILDQAGTVRSVRPHQISMKRDSGRAVAMDCEGGEFRASDSMKEAEGEEREGVVLHIYLSSIVWLFNRDYKDNGGVFLARARQLRPRAPAGAAGTTNLSKQNPVLMASMPQQMRAPALGGGASSNMRRPGGRDPLAGKTVAIVRGPYKSYRGIIKDSNGATARVELMTAAKMLTVDVSMLVEKDPYTGQSRPLMGGPMGRPGGGPPGGPSRGPPVGQYGGPPGGNFGGPPSAGPPGGYARNPYL